MDLKKLVLVVLLCLVGGIGYAQEQAKPATPAAAGVKFSLDEERYVAAFQKEGQAKFEKEIEEAVGAKIPTEVDFPSFAGDYDSMKYVDGSWCTGEIVSALKQICTDDIGKKRVAAAVKKIVIKNDPNVTPETAFKSEGGTLTVSCHLSKTGVSSGELMEFLKKNL